MKSISWNVCGLGSPRTVRRLRHFLKQHNPQMVFLMETKVNKQCMEKVRRSCGFLNGIDVAAKGFRGGLCLAWKGEILVTLRSFSRSHTDVMVKEENDKEEWRFTGFYGSLYVKDKEESWNLLRKLGRDQRHPWLVSGDFNEIMYSFEKKGGLAREERRMEAFKKTLEECQLEDLGYTGAWFTWERGNLPKTNIRERLDRGVANDKWRNLFPSGNIQHLIHTMSDYCPLLLNSKTGNTYVGRPRFKFEAWWIMEDSLEGIIKTSWETSASTLMEKLEKLQSNLKEWYATPRRKRNNISRLELDGGGEVTEEDKISKAAKTFFQKLFSSKGVGELSHLLTGIDGNITPEMNADLMRKFTKEEVLLALKGMGLTKALRPDGFPALFFQQYWHIVGKEVTSFCLGCLNSGKTLGRFNATDIVLIPKIQNPKNLANFRPISLCTVIYKLVAKTIANRLQGVIGQCIDVAQSTFVPGRLISDNILIAYELLHTFTRKRTGKKGLMAVKLDMSKAYDRVE
ncbi:uncharacterized protein LOC128032639 [Gossypium raimondii]|uniref:uncharacterized protein LOC128032639 n=1 Tax=Gossypium raimondii TaxID=29730 RepID=UPI00227CF9CE|nr:uncharacterized protein LOC128032639 [Gossypium raimondii]